ncbi:MAG TPA: DNA methyltransferase [Candidatus Limnocylindrales bacterium]|nr:DNA methyltransferase [Candidatus Limnocylindrales bacterium]
MNQPILTKRQAEVLNYIAKYTAHNKYAPTLAEIAKKFNLASVSTAHFHVTKLHEAGYLAKLGHKSRALKIYNAELSAMSRQPSGLPDNAKKPTHYNKLPINKIILGDTTILLKKIPSESCDIIIIDPPYNIGKNFGNNLDKRELKDYIEWSKIWLYESVRILKPTGTMFVYGYSEILAYLSIEIPLPKRWLIWHYTNKNVASLNFWQRSYESIICAWKDKPVFNRDAVREPYTDGFLSGAAGKVRRGTVGRFSKNAKETVYNAHTLGALPRDVIKIAALAGGAGMTERWFMCKDCNDVFAPMQLKHHRTHMTEKHPTQKPLQLSRKLIRSAMPPNRSVVLVPFAGTGSECAAAKELGQDYIGIELNPDYVRLAEKFIASVQPPLDHAL